MHVFNFWGKLDYSLRGQQSITGNQVELSVGTKRKSQHIKKQCETRLNKHHSMPLTFAHKYREKKIGLARTKSTTTLKITT